MKINLKAYRIGVLVLLLAILAWSATTQELNYVEYQICNYSELTKNYCTDNEKTTAVNGSATLTVTEDSIVTFVFSKVSSYTFRLNGIEKSMNSEKESVTISWGTGSDGAIYRFVKGPTYFNFIKDKNWAIYFIGENFKDNRGLKSFNFGKKNYSISTLAICAYNEKNDEYDRCRYDSYTKPLSFDIKSDLKNDKIYLNIDAFPEIEVSKVDERKNGDGEVVHVFHGIGATKEDLTIVLGESYFVILTDDIKYNYSGRLYNKEDSYTNSSSHWSVSGSGVAINNEILITNAHVTKGLSYLSISQDGKKIETDGFSLVAEYPEDFLDLAIIRVKGANLFSCPISSKEPELGTEVLVYGYPMIDYQGEDLKVTKGVVSGRNGLHGDKATFQMDAAIQHGNSGGPIVSNGKIIGLATGILNVEKSQNVNIGIKSSRIVKALDYEKIKPKATTSDFKKCTYLLEGE